MKIFMFTTIFAPSVGGIELRFERLATQFAELGHEVVLSTLTPGPEAGPWNFPVVRRPVTRQFLSLLRWCDVHLQANLSLWHLHPLGMGAPFVVSHGTDYQRPDGKRTLRDRAKLVCARRAYGIACSRYIAQRVECRDIINNSYDDRTFRTETPLDRRTRDIAFVGRLVSDKGCDTLLTALAMLRDRGLTPSCTIIGDGPERDTLRQLAISYSLPGVTFSGLMKGRTIAETLNEHRIIVVPSRFAEPFGIVALEGLACGCFPIVSAKGGLIDAIGPHGVTFENGDPTDLADHLQTVLVGFDRARTMLEGVERHLAEFTARRVAEKYLGAFERAMASA